MASLIELGCTTNIQVIERFVPLQGLFVIDAGCGGFVMTRLLSDLGARVLAIDPDPIQAKLNRAADPIANVQFVETGAESLPVEASTVDGIFFSYSLHHISAAMYPAVFDEVFRVLKPDGFLCVIEPTVCPLNDVIKLFHDEDQCRAAAQQTLEQIAIPAFNSATIVRYHSFSQYASFEQFADHFSSRSFNLMYTAADVRKPEVNAAFDRLGGTDHRFMSPRQLTYLKSLKTARI